MRAKEFGDLVGDRMAELGLSQRRLASRLGELSDGRIFDASQIRLIRQGRRRLDRELVQRLIDLLGMDEAEAWAAAGLWPPDLGVEEYRRFRHSAFARAGKLSPEYVGTPGQLVGLPSDLDGDVIRRLRPRRDRRHNDRRKPAYRPVAPELLRAS